MADYLNLAGSIKQIEDGLYVLRTIAGQLAAENAALKDKHNNRKKLSERDAERIREMHGRFKQRELAEMFDVNPATVSRIVRGQYWKR